KYLFKWLIMKNGHESGVISLIYGIMLVIAGIGQGWQSSDDFRENFCCFNSPSYDMGKNFTWSPFFIILSFYTSFHGLCCCYNEFLVSFIEGLNKLLFYCSPVCFNCLMCFLLGFF